MKSHTWLLMGVMLAGGVHAVPQYGPGPAPMPYGPNPYGMPVPQMNNPAVALRAGIDKLLGFLDSQDSVSPEDLADFLNSEIAPFFDFEYMASAAGGRIYEQMSPIEQQEMAEDIKRTFLTKMTEKLASYDNQQVQFLRPRSENDGQTAVVGVAILNPGNYPARLDFRLYRGEQGWKVYDVAANGHSAIVHYRRQMMRQMRAQQMQQMQRMRQMAPQMGPGGPGGYGPYGPQPMR